ncbi:hypothetical protein BC628DRAFT_165239 [Trametes gibbosa]|nr:hypothetical protein BC628DRAFT_165239 [Trametes gibbosa]
MCPDDTPCVYGAMTTARGYSVQILSLFVGIHAETRKTLSTAAKWQTRTTTYLAVGRIGLKNPCHKS